ncbi:acyl-CoA dehydrogenase family protein [Microbacterium saperdae]|uniref:glutaryl-CoA dehydrogenase (ETF) n=1 Tax=Microbacterium saperdae TaxID=69368 RepID=A0A543BL92_9MICO|nr:acyl-CoA dehydrogenase family protein [Microbacterium saperdae]TQL85610.1 glutaryl-CoA dehydrogenase [Microbacterium saperdae]GGM62276.1 acyl-CoA dehydrogenase [Microbacterium saperdae]
MTTTIDTLLDLESRLTPAEIMWREVARTLVDEHIRPVIDDDFEAQRFRPEILRALGRTGLLSLPIASRDDGETVGYGLACMELEAGDSSYRTLLSVQSSLAMTSIDSYGSEEQKDRWLPAMAAGEALGCFALTEPHSGSDPGGMTTSATRRGDDWVLSGAKRWIGLANHADVAVVWARAEDGVRGFLVDTASRGFSAVPIGGKLSLRASVQCDVTFDDVVVPSSAALPGAEGLGTALACLVNARYGIAWGVMGAARSSFESALDLSRRRRAFGEPLARRQLVQAKLADMFTDYQRGVLVALHLGRLKAEKRLSAAQVSTGKLGNVRLAQRIVRTARGVLGGDGVTSAFPVMRHMANLEAVSTYEGTEEIHQLIIGRTLTAENAIR